MHNGEIGDNVKSLRIEKNFTQKNLSENIDYSDVQISYIETGKSRASTKGVINIANTFNSPLGRIVDRSCENKCEIQVKNGDWIGNLSMPETLLILKILEDIKNKIREFQEEKRQNRQYVCEEIDYADAGHNIAKLREEKHIDKTVMSKRMEKRSGMKEGTYRNIENNNGTVSLNNYMEIAKELDTSIDYIFEKSIKNKEMACREYIKRIFGDIDNSEEREMLNEIGEAIKRVLEKYMTMDK